MIVIVAVVCACLSKGASVVFVISVGCTRVHSTRMLFLESIKYEVPVGIISINVIVSA